LAGRITAASGCDERLAGNPTRRLVTTKPCVHRRSDIGELAGFVDPTGRVPPFDVCEQQRVLA